MRTCRLHQSFHMEDMPLFACPRRCQSTMVWSDILQTQLSTRKAYPSTTLPPFHPCLSFCQAQSNQRSPSQLLLLLHMVITDGCNWLKLAVADCLCVKSMQRRL